MGFNNLKLKLAKFFSKVLFFPSISSKIKKSRKKDREGMPPYGLLMFYRMMAIKPPEPSLMILPSVSCNLYLALSGIMAILPYTFSHNGVQRTTEHV